MFDPAEHLGRFLLDIGQLHRRQFRLPQFRERLLHSIADCFEPKHIRVKFAQTLLVNLPPLRGLKKRATDDTSHGRLDRNVWPDEHRVQPMRDEYHLIRGRVMIEAVVICMQRITVPVGDQHFDRRKRGELLHIQYPVKPLKALP